MIRNTKVKVQDVHRAIRIYGPTVGALRGKTKMCTPLRVDLESGRAITVHERVRIHLDIMFAQGVAFLIAVITPLCLVIVELLKGRTYGHVRAALGGIISKLSIECNGEGSFGKMQAEYGHDVDLTYSGEQSADSERTSKMNHQHITFLSLSNIPRLRRQAHHPHDKQSPL
jgi:hypothetical protein